MPDLGLRMFSQNVVLRGRMDEAGWRAFLVASVEGMGMAAAGEPAMWAYPTAGGKGGNGLTVCQPMVESFVVVDTWPDHDGAYLHISSCRPFDVDGLNGAISAFGLEKMNVGGLEVMGL